MKSISLDFKNNRICIMTDGQQGTEHGQDMKKEKFNSFIPDKFREYNSFTWNFEAETFAVNQDYNLKDGCIMTKDCFIPEVILPMHGLKKRYDEFIAILGYEETAWKTEDFPEELRGLFSL